MRIAYFDCFSGASGDMILGACISAGLDIEQLRTDLADLSVPGFTVHADAIRKQGFAATQFDVRVDPTTDKPHRHLRHVRAIIEGSNLPPRVRERAMAIFTRLGEAEASVHGTTIEKVHFHEVGAIDAIVDIVGASLAMERLGVDRIVCSPIPTGSGTVHCDHGLMPVPTPATAALLQGVPLAPCEEIGELTTPTGAAILTTLSSAFGPLPAMRLERVGVGAGRREGQTRANILRLLVGEAIEGKTEEESDEVLALEANLDDVTGEVIGYVQDRLFEAGALDVYLVPIYMKKNRPATLLTVLVPPDNRDAVLDILFRETTTFGVRTQRMHRAKLARTIETVSTPDGEIRVKIGRRAGRVVRVSPEFEDCRAAAVRAGRPIAEVMDDAVRAWRARGGSPPSP